MISKELLSEVVGLCCSVKSIRNSEVVYWFNCIGEVRESSINIYELMHMCKEWARDNEFFLRSFYDYEGAFCYISAPEWVDKIDIPKTGFCSDTELDAVFKACEWILNNKGIK